MGPYIWSGRRDLNPRLQPWQGCTLPLSYSRVVERKRLYRRTGEVSTEKFTEGRFFSKFFAASFSGKIFFPLTGGMRYGTMRKNSDILPIYVPSSFSVPVLPFSGARCSCAFFVCGRESARLRAGQGSAGASASGKAQCGSVAGLCGRLSQSTRQEPQMAAPFGGPVPERGSS